MSSYEYSSSESETDEEYEQELKQLDLEKRRDELAHDMWDLLDRNNIRSPLGGPMDGAMLNKCLNPELKMDDVRKLMHVENQPSFCVRFELPGPGRGAH